MKPIIKVIFIFCLLFMLSGCSVVCNYTIQSTPKGADILVDGKMIGKTPATVDISFTDNSQKVTEKKIIFVKLEGYKEFKEILSYEGDSSKKLNFELDPETSQK